MSDEYLDDLSLPPVLALPNAPVDEEDLLDWAKEVHVVLQNSYVPTTDRIENLVMMDDKDNKLPEAKGTRRFFFNTKANKLYLDATLGSSEDASGKWIWVGGSGTSESGESTGFLTNPMANDYYLQGIQSDLVTASNLVGLSSGDIATFGSVDVETAILALTTVSIDGADLELDINQYLLGNSLNLIGTNAGGNILLGDSVAGDVWADSSNIGLNHGFALLGEDAAASDSYVWLAGVSSSIAKFGSTGLRTSINALDYVLLLQHALLDTDIALLGLNQAGSTAINLISLDASDDIVIGQTAGLYPDNIYLAGQGGYVKLDDMNLRLENARAIYFDNAVNSPYAGLYVNVADQMVLGHASEFDLFLLSGNGYVKFDGCSPVIEYGFGYRGYNFGSSLINMMFFPTGSNNISFGAPLYLDYDLILGAGDIDMGADGRIDWSGGSTAQIYVTSGDLRIGGGSDDLYLFGNNGIYLDDALWQKSATTSTYYRLFYTTGTGSVYIGQSGTPVNLYLYDNLTTFGDITVGENQQLKGIPGGISRRMMDYSSTLLRIGAGVAGLNIAMYPASNGYVQISNADRNTRYAGIFLSSGSGAPNFADLGNANGGWGFYLNTVDKELFIVMNIASAARFYSLGTGATSP
jgi:hypothetical protein